MHAQRIGASSHANNNSYNFHRAASMQPIEHHDVVVIFYQLVALDFVHSSCVGGTFRVEDRKYTT